MTNIGKEGVEGIIKVCASGDQGFAEPLIKRQGGESLTGGEKVTSARTIDVVKA